jgi:prophage tail gpP-like protein
MPGTPEEQAILEVNGEKYEDWESVMVRYAMKEHPHIQFRFTCSENSPMAHDWNVLRIRPGDACQITLAGEPAVTGLVSTRQVFYNATRHSVEIRGASDTIELQSTHAKTAEYKDTTYMQYAQQVLQPFGFGLKVLGGALSDQKFPRLVVRPGTTVMDALDGPLRALGGPSLTSNPLAREVQIAAGPKGGDDKVEEGVTILEGREVIYNEGMATGLQTIAQMAGTDQKWGPKVAQAAKQQMGIAGLGIPNLSNFLHLEAASVDPQHMAGRNNAERKWQADDRICLFITVYGWLRPSGGLWQHDQTVSVISPMLIMKGDEQLVSRSVTFSQDNETGTRTVLELVNQAELAGIIPQSQDK